MKFCVTAYDGWTRASLKRELMRGFVSLLLISVIVACQGLYALDTHYGCTSELSSSQSNRPHFHVHGAHSHGSHHHARGHRHDQKPELPAVTGESFPSHDADACYCPDSVSSTIQRSSTADAIDYLLSDLASGFSEIIVLVGSPALDVRPDSPRQWSNARIPLYLRSLAIRC